MRQELGGKGPQQPPTFFNPQTPMHSANSTKVGGFLQNQSTSVQSQMIPYQPGSTGLGHWNSMHPNRNFNVVTTKSNF